jgi:phospholipid/cholesterol/gamma-HCH transport system substrate-binding protein
MAVLRRRLLGLLLLVVIAAFLAASILFYNHAFTAVVPVTLKTDTAGNELQQNSDVKVHGLLVGSVASVSSTGNGAVLTLNLQPDMVHLIPANVSAELLPKTLFGERYVDLEVPAHPQGTLAAGDVIGQAADGAEVEKVLDDLLPVLQAVQPQKLSETLTAISQALQGRGPELGHTLDELGSYVGQLNPQLPTLEHDLAALAAASGTYNEAAPHLLNALSNLTVTSQTLAQQAPNLENLYATVTTAAGNLNNFLAANEDNLIGVSQQSLPTLQTLARYSPEYPCFLQQMAQIGQRVNQAFGQGTNQPGLHATIEITVNRGPYLPGQDNPQYADNRGPRCYDLKPAPDPFPQYAPDGPLDDGSTHPPAARSATDGTLPGGNFSAASTIPSAANGDIGVPNSPAEEGMIDELLGAQDGKSPQQEPGWSSLLVGPLFRGSEVNLK